jgi:hypothetical protein
MTNRRSWNARDGHAGVVDATDKSSDLRDAAGVRFADTGFSTCRGEDEEMTMGGTEDTGVDELGPVDYMVVEFPPGAQNFNGEMAAELVRLSDAGTIRVLDLLILQKGADGSIDAYEIDETDADKSDAAEELRALEKDLAEILAAEDVEHLAAAMEPGSVAGVLVWENTWAAPFASAARRSGGQLIASGRIPIQAMAASMEAELAAEEGN